MVRKNKCKKSGFSTILFAVAAIMLSAVPCAWADVTVPAGEIWDIPSDTHPNPASESLVVNGTVNLLPGADIQWFVYATGTSTVNITGGTVGYWINVAPGATVTAYAASFEVDGIPVPPSEWEDVEINGFLKGYDENGATLFNIKFDCHDGSTVTLASPSTDPVQMLIDLGLYILEQVYEYQEPIPPDIELIGIAPELEVSLLAKVDAALAALVKGNPNDAKVAMNDMKALINQVMAQTDKKISIEVSGCIQADADAIITALGG